MSNANGSPLSDIWKAGEAHNECDISHKQIERIIFQLGVITEALSRLSFSQAGSLLEEDGQFCIKTCLSRGLLLNQRHDIEDIPRGPFNSEKDYYSAHLSAYFEQVKYLPLSHHCFLAPIPARSAYDSDADFRQASD